MEQIDPSRIIIGNKAEYNLYAKGGQLLISKGMTITDLHIGLLKKRKVAVYLAESDASDFYNKITNILNKKTDGVDLDDSGELKEELDLDESETSNTSEAPKGEVKHHTILSRNMMDVTFDIGGDLPPTSTNDKPLGAPLKHKAIQISTEERTRKYKEEIKASYEKSLTQTTHLMDSLANNTKFDSNLLKTIVEKYVKVYVTDRNILLNISGTKKSIDYLYYHSLNVCLLSINIAAARGYSAGQIIELGMCALLHDMGMMRVDKKILKKPGRLTAKERYEIESHSMLGASLIRNIGYLSDVVPNILYQVHEREDGSGYPKKRAGRLVHRFAKIIQIADIYEAMTAPRSYRRAFQPFEAMRQLILLTRHGKISNEIMKSFLSYTSLFPVGSLVELNNGSIAKVISANEEAYTEPVVSVLTDSSKDYLGPNGAYQVNLYKDGTDLKIVKPAPSNALKDVNIMDGF